jgi:hypothetical protein
MVATVSSLPGLGLGSMFSGPSNANQTLSDPNAVSVRILTMAVEGSESLFINAMQRFEERVKEVMQERKTVSCCNLNADEQTIAVGVRLCVDPPPHYVT